LIDHARNDRPSTPEARHHPARVSPDTFAAARHERASASSRIFRFSIPSSRCTNLEGDTLAVIPASLMGHG
jgi:hypothetical protein